MNDVSAKPAPRRKRAAAPTTPDPVEIAMAAEASGRGPQGVAAALLVDQRRLIRWQIASERAGFALKVLAVTGVLLAAAGLGAMAWSAYGRERLVIDPFSVPADLAQAGATGEAVASQLKDKLATMNEETVSPLAGVVVRDRAASEVKVELGTTGVSLDELDRLLRGWLGREAHVSGEVMRITSGPQTGALALSVRVDGRPGARLVQPDGDLDALTARAAERVYAARDGFRFASWLMQHQRAPEARQAIWGLTRSAKPRDRARAYYMLTAPELIGPGERVPDREPLLRAALRHDPTFSPALNDLGVHENSRGRLEQALALYRRSQDAPPLPGATPEGRRVGKTVNEANIAGAFGDYGAQLRTTCLAYELKTCSDDAMLAAALAGPPTNRFDAGRNTRVPISARMLALRGRTTDAWRLAEPHAEDPGWKATRVTVLRLREDWPGVIAETDGWEAAAAKGLVSSAPNGPSLWRPLALAKVGRRAEAEQLAASRPADCQPCIRVRAAVAAERGAWAAADRWFAEAVRLAPSFPYAEAEWAASLLARGRPDAAIEKAAAAARKGPRFAEAKVVWGEALLAKGDARAAAVQLAAAARLTPRWGRAHLKWGEALAAQGKTGEARARWRAAAGMDLTPAERARVTALLAGARA